MLSPFFSFNFSSSSGIATSTALHAIRRFHRQYCSRRSDPDQFTFFLHFQNFSSAFREILKGKGLFHVKARHMQTRMLHYLKGLLSPPLFQLRKVFNSFLQYAKAKGDQSTVFKVGKNLPGNKRVIIYLLAACKRASDCLQNNCKSYQTPFRAYCMWNPRIACNANNICNIQLGELNLIIFLKWKQVLKFCLPSAVFILM